MGWYTSGVSCTPHMHRSKWMDLVAFCSSQWPGTPAGYLVPHITRSHFVQVNGLVHQRSILYPTYATEPMSRRGRILLKTMARDTSGELCTPHQSGTICSSQSPVIPNKFL